MSRPLGGVTIELRSSRGQLTVEFALNGWVLLECGSSSHQARVSKKKQLAAVLHSELAFDEVEAGELAAAVWRQRPGDASMGESQPDVWASSRSMLRETGFPAWMVLLIVVAAIAVVAGVALLVSAVGDHVFG